MGKISESLPNWMEAVVGQTCNGMLESRDRDLNYCKARFKTISLIIGSGTPISNAAAATIAESAGVPLPAPRAGVIVDYHNDYFYVLYNHDAEYILYRCGSTL